MLILKTPKEILLEIAERAKNNRLAQNLTQEGLSLRANVSLGSLKRFERTGKISFESLIKIAFALNCLDALENLFINQKKPLTLDELLITKKQPKRGRLK